MNTDEPSGSTKDESDYLRNCQLLKKKTGSTKLLNATKTPALLSPPPKPSFFINV
jgi:hypothetical protein